jgi:hypothetical protein
MSGTSVQGIALGDEIMALLLEGYEETASFILTYSLCCYDCDEVAGGSLESLEAPPVYGFRE